MQYNISSNKLGKLFEKYIAQIFIDLDKFNVKNNVILKIKNKNNVLRSEFDIIYGLIFKKYIECKFKSDLDDKVSAKEVGFFAEKLKLHNKYSGSGIIITNSYLTNRAKAIGLMNNIKIIEREDLEKLDYERMNFFNSIKYLLSKNKFFCRKIKYYSLEERIYNNLSYYD